MKFKTILVLISATTLTSVAQAAAIADISIYFDWSTMSITGATMTPTTVTDPTTGQPFSSDAEGYVGSQGGDLDVVYSSDGASAIASYNNGVLNLTGGYNAATASSGGSVTVTNIGPGMQEAYAGGWHGMVYKATSTGQVMISVNYSIDTSVSTDSLFENSASYYDVNMNANDVDVFISTYNDAINSGSTPVDAVLAADSASILTNNSFFGSPLSCWGKLCSETIPLSDTLAITFDITTDKAYVFGANATASVHTDVNAVPVPAAVWLFGSGFFGLIGIARRKAHA